MEVVGPAPISAATLATDHAARRDHRDRAAATLGSSPGRADRSRLRDGATTADPGARADLAGASSTDTAEGATTDAASSRARGGTRAGAGTTAPDTTATDTAGPAPDATADTPTDPRARHDSSRGRAARGPRATR